MSELNEQERARMAALERTPWGSLTDAEQQKLIAAYRRPELPGDEREAKERLLDHAEAMREGYEQRIRNLTTALGKAERERDGANEGCEASARMLTETRQRAEKAEAEVAQLQQRIGELERVEEAYKGQNLVVDRLGERVERLREALSFYGDESKWRRYMSGTAFERISAVEKDGGKLARKALAVSPSVSPSGTPSPFQRPAVMTNLVEEQEVAKDYLDRQGEPSVSEDDYNDELNEAARKIAATQQVAPTIPMPRRRLSDEPSVSKEQSEDTAPRFVAVCQSYEGCRPDENPLRDPELLIVVREDNYLAALRKKVNVTGRRVVEDDGSLGNVVAVSPGEQVVAVDDYIRLLRLSKDQEITEARLLEIAMKYEFQRPREGFQTDGGCASAMRVALSQEEGE